MGRRRRVRPRARPRPRLLSRRHPAPPYRRHPAAGGRPAGDRVAVAGPGLRGPARARAGTEPVTEATQRVVLVHGAWHGAWCWERVAAPLRERGYDVVVPDLPGHASRAD